MTEQLPGDPNPTSKDSTGQRERTISAMDEAECMDLLARHEFGRIGFTTATGPQIYPVNYTVDGGQIVIRTSPYSGLFVNSVGLVAFQIDDIEASLQRGWSVLVVGTCAQVEDPDEAIALRRAGSPQPWAAGQRNVFVRITPRDVTGRRIS